MQTVIEHKLNLSLGSVVTNAIQFTSENAIYSKTSSLYLQLSASQITFFAVANCRTEL